MENIIEIDKVIKLYNSYVICHNKHYKKYFYIFLSDQVSYNDEHISMIDFNFIQDNSENFEYSKIKTIDDIEKYLKKNSPNSIIKNDNYIKHIMNTMNTYTKENNIEWVINNLDNIILPELKKHEFYEEKLKNIGNINNINNILLKYIRSNIFEYIKNLDEPYEIIYINMVINEDDNILELKNKIFYKLKIDIEDQYLFIDPYDLTDDELNDQLEYNKYLYINHYFTKYEESKFKKKSNSSIKYQIKKFPLNPFSENIIIDDMDFYDKERHKENEDFIKNSSDDYIINDLKYTSFIIFLVSHEDANRMLTEKGLENDLVMKNIYLRYYWPFKNSNLLDTNSQNLQINTAKHRKDIVNLIDKNIKTVELINFFNINNDVILNNRIIETVIHINYTKDTEENIDDFIDLYKIFDQFELNINIPFIKYKTDVGKSLCKVYIDKYENSNNEINEKTMREWIGNSIKKTNQIEDGFKKVGRGISLKIKSYISKDGKVNYNTLNIYKNGRMELKIYIQESYADEIGNIEYINKCINSVNIYFFDILKNIEYQINGYKHISINTPKEIKYENIKYLNSSFDNNKNNSYIAFMNTSFIIDYEKLYKNTQIIKFFDFNYFAEYFNTFIAVIHKQKLSGEKEIITIKSDDSIEFRYKRITNYIKMNTIDKYMYDFISANNSEGGKISEDLINKLTLTFSLSKQNAEIIYKQFVTKYANQNKNVLNIKKKNEDIEYSISKLNKHPGIDILIKYTNNKFKVSLKGTHPFNELSRITTFITNLFKIYFFDINNRLVFRRYIEKPEKLDYVNRDEEINNNQFDALKYSYKQQISSYEDNINDLNKEIKKLTLNLNNIDSELKTLYLEIKNLEEENDDSVGDMLDQLYNIIDDYSSKKNEIILNIRQTDSKINDINNKKTDIEKKLQELEDSVDNTENDKKHLTKYNYKSIIRLKNHNSIYGNPSNKYGKRCQANRRQPLIIPISEYNEIISNLLAELHKYENDKLLFKPDTKEYKDIEEIIKIINFNIKIHKNGINFMDNHYFCTNAYDITSKQAVPWTNDTQSNIIKINSRYIKNPTQNYETPQEYPYARFLPKKDDGDNCLVCCFIDDQDIDTDCKLQENKLDNIDKYMITPVNQDAKDETLNVIYVLKNEKLYIPENRMARLPKPIYNILGFKYELPDNKHHICNTPTIIRIGNKQDNRSPFVHAIAKILSFSDKFNENDTSYMKFMKLLTDKKKGITFNEFKSMKSGTLKMSFKNNPYESDELVYNRFITYLKTNLNYNEDYIWDILSNKFMSIYEDNPKIIEKINIIIFEAKINKLDNLNNIIVCKCPIGYNMNDFYDNTRKTIILFKYGHIYENVIIVNKVKKELNLTEQKTIFTPENHSDIINNLIKYTVKCSNTINKQYYEFEKKYLQNTFKNNNLIYEPIQLSLTETFNELINFSENLTIFGQYIDHYNKVSHLCVTYEGRNYLIPIKPSVSVREPLIGQKIIILNKKYREEDIILRIISPIEFDKILEIKHDIMTIYKFYNKLPKSLRLNPLLYKINPVSNMIKGFILKNKLEIEFIINDNKKSLSEFMELNMPSFDQYYDTLHIINKSLISTETLKGIQNEYINKKKYEKELYQRIRYEVCKYLDNNKKMLNGELYDINYILEIDTKLLIDTKRIQLFKIIFKIILELSTFDMNLKNLYYIQNLNFDEVDNDGNLVAISKNSKRILNYSSIEDIYYKYNTNNIRNICYNKEIDIISDNKLRYDQHCSIEHNSNYDYVISNLSKVNKTKTETQTIIGSSKLFIPFYNIFKEHNISKHELNQQKQLLSSDIFINNIITVEDFTKFDLNIYVLKFTIIIVEELLLNKLKRVEILNNEVDDLINKDHYNENNDTLLIDEEGLNNDYINDRLDLLYTKTDLIKNKLYSSYDVAKPALYRTGYDDLSGCISEIKPLPNIWIEKIGTKYKRITKSSNNQCIFNSLSQALNNISNVTITSDIIKGNISSYVQHMEELYEYYNNIMEEQLNRLKLKKNVKELYIKFEYTNLFCEQITFRSPHKLWLDLHMAFNDGTNSLLNDVNSIEELVNFINSSEYSLKTLDILILSIKYNIPIIILNNVFKQNHSMLFNTHINLLNYDNEKELQSQFVILLLRYADETFEILINDNKFPNEYVHLFQDLPIFIQNEYIKIQELNKSYVIKSDSIFEQINEYAGFSLYDIKNLLHYELKIPTRNYELSGNKNNAGDSSKKLHVKLKQYEDLENEYDTQYEEYVKLSLDSKLKSISSSSISRSSTSTSTSASISTSN